MHRILFWGAGASVPFHTIPITTKVLTNYVKDLTEWDKLVNQYNKLISPRMALK